MEKEKWDRLKALKPSAGKYTWVSSKPDGSRAMGTKMNIETRMRKLAHKATNTSVVATDTMTKETEIDPS